MEAEVIVKVLLSQESVLSLISLLYRKFPLSPSGLLLVYSLEFHYYSSGVLCFCAVHTVHTYAVL